ncbi:MAG: DUF2752 domain-containing protein [Candidatus Krumholzibacteria bacterium]|nr:DUF2752 domain-containing protein [Candidatus Krumholzibacteria bacterium]
MKIGPENSPVARLLLFAFFPLLIGALILVRMAPDFVLGLAYCPLRESTGFPCPTCGGTLAATHLVGHHWLAAVAANPLLVGLGGLYVLLAIYATAATVVPSWRRSLQLTATEKKTARWLAILLLALNWAWLVRRYLF